MKKPALTEKKINKHDAENCRVEGCVMCALRIPFDLPSDILEAYKNGNLVIFAGSGVSTESSLVLPFTFSQQIKYKLNIPKDEKIGFSRLMTLFSSSPRTRKDLFREIRNRIDYVKSFPQLYGLATEFHRELSTIPHLDEIFTTNWDDFFERECRATPIVTGKDFAVLQDTFGRKVFKLHGSIYNYGSIVATEKDYQRCYSRLSKGIIGAKLKILLMSKTLLFFGFSFDDEDFQRLYRLLRKEVGGLIPESYVVTIDKNAEEKLSSLKINATPIITGAAFFIQQFKKKLVEEKLMLPDEKYNGIYKALKKVSKEHGKTDLHYLENHPDCIYSLFYQDGLQHALQRIISTMNSGDYSCEGYLLDLIKRHEDHIKKLLHDGKYEDVAYYTGYRNGLLYFLFNEKDRELMPIYFLFKCDEILDFDQYLKLEKNAAKTHKAAHKLAKKIGVNYSKGLIPQYIPRAIY